MLVVLYVDVRDASGASGAGVRVGVAHGSRRRAAGPGGGPAAPLGGAGWGVLAAPGLPGGRAGRATAGVCSGFFRFLAGS